MNAMTIYVIDDRDKVADIDNFDDSVDPILAVQTETQINVLYFIGNNVYAIIPYAFASCTLKFLDFFIMYK